MNWVIDGVLVLIVAFFAWRGYRNGFIRGIFGILAVVIAIYGANLAASAYSSEFTGMLKPFVGGVVDKAVGNVLNTDGSTNADSAGTGDKTPSGSATPSETSTTSEPAKTPKPDTVLTGDEKTNVFDVSFAALRDIGLATGASKLIADKVGAEMTSVGQTMSVYLTEKLSDSLAYIAVFAIAFILIAIIFAVIGNIFNLALSIPGLNQADNIIGLILGILKGLLIVLVIAVVIRYFGLVSSENIEKTTVLSFLLNKNPLANILGI